MLRASTQEEYLSRLRARNQRFLFLPRPHRLDLEKPSHFYIKQSLNKPRRILARLGCLFAVCTASAWLQQQLLVINSSYR
jgi:hypothetical protein